MSDPIGSARKKYRRRVEEAKKRAIGQLKYIELGSMKRGEVIRLRIPVVHLPHIKYGPWTPGIGSGPGKEGEKVFPSEEGSAGRKGGRGAAEAIYEDITVRDLVNWMKSELELETIKPAKRKKEIDKITYPAISSRGSESLLDLDETLYAMVDRQVVAGDFRQGGLQIKIEEEDLRYRFPKVKYKPYKDALVIYIRDISESITQADLEASYILSFLVDTWLKEFYPKVERVYIAHNDSAWEEMEENYYRLKSGGGTSYSPAYDILAAMMTGRDYERKTQVKRKIDYSDMDIYVIQMTDGENWDYEGALSRLGRLMPNLTRLCYLETHFYEEQDTKYLVALKNVYSSQVKEGKIRLCTIGKKDDLWKAMKEFFGKR